MITVEKDINAEEITIYAAPEDLRDFAKLLWQISEKAETKGKHKEQLSTKSSSEIPLSTKLKGEPKKHRIVKQLSIVSKVD